VPCSRYDKIRYRIEKIMQKSRPDEDKMKVCFLYKALSFQVTIIKKTAKGGFATSGCGFGMYEVW
jgi:hypothetical protein